MRNTKQIEPCTVEQTVQQQINLQGRQRNGLVVGHIVLRSQLHLNCLLLLFIPPEIS